MLTPQEVMKQRASGQLVDVVRPLPFHGAKAVISANLKKGGAEKNPLSTLDNQGVYFDRYAKLLAPTLNVFSDVRLIMAIAADLAHL